MTRLPYLKRIVDLIADDRWAYVGPDGNRVTSRVCVGRPQPWPGDRQGDWMCSVSIDHFTDGVRPIAGVGPVDALMNAMAVVKAFAEQVGQFTPRASDFQQGSRQLSSGTDAKRRRSTKKTRRRTNTHLTRRKRSTA